MNLKSVIFLVVCAFCLGAWMVQRRRKVTRVDEVGVLFVRSLSKPLFLAWAEIDQFGIASCITIEGGLYGPGFTQYLGIKLADSSPRKATRACADNRRLSDYDLLITPDSGMSVLEFAAFLEAERAKPKTS